MQRLSRSSHHQQQNFEYFIQVVKNGEEPEWPVPEDELDIHSRKISLSFTQWWAYPKSEAKDKEELPDAEKLANKNQTPYPAILINELDKTTHDLELILVRDGHAYARSLSSLPNLEDNLAALLDYAHKELNFAVEHFMTTQDISPVVDAKLDEIEQEEDDLEGSSAIPASRPSLEDGILTSTHVKDGSKIIIIAPALLLILALTGFIAYKSGLAKKLGVIEDTPKSVPVSVTPSPVPEATATPLPEINKKDFKIRVLNGTLTSGAASSLADKLKDAGWTVAKVGNNKDTTITRTQVRTKKGLNNLSSVLLSDVVKFYDATVSAELAGSDIVDAEVVIGKK